MRTLASRNRILNEVLLWAAAFFAGASAFTGCSNIGIGKAAKETKTLSDLGEWFKANGVEGHFTLEDIYAPKDRGGGKVFTPVRPVGLVSAGTFTDAVDNKIRWTYCGIELFDSEENAKKAIKDPKTDFVNGRFRLWTPEGGIHRGKDNNLVYVFSQFQPYR